MAEKHSTTLTQSGLGPRDENVGMSVDPEIERRILRRLDLTLLPTLFFLFLVSYLDRGNIGMLPTTPSSVYHVMLSRE